jgi:signal transduction histidine kinase
MHLAPRPLDLGPFTRGVVAAFAPVAERKGIRLTVETVDALRGAFDADAIEKILTNLLSNAIKFTPSGGSVSVALSNEGGSARLAVRDSGPGSRPIRLHTCSSDSTRWTSRRRAPSQEPELACRW